MNMGKFKALAVQTSRECRGGQRWLLRRGLTLVELLVVMTIIGVLVALLIPAVRAARDSARFADCKNNLRQLGLASTMFADAHGHYAVDGTNGYGTSAFLLPYVEQQVLYDQMQPDKQLRPRHGSQPGACGVALAVMRCSASGSNPHTETGFGRSSFVGTSDLFPWQVRDRQVRDGKSNTICMGETLMLHAWAFPGTGSVPPPNGGGVFASEHELGANFVFCDGSVHFVDEAVSPKVFRALCTIDAGDSVDGWQLKGNPKANEIQEGS